jgi:hypothetical protein
MDLPLVGSSSPKETTKKSVSISGNLDAEAAAEDDASAKLESPQGPESPDMQTAAERFAKQNQCTLKKNTKVHVDNSDLSADPNLITITSPMPERKYATIGNATTTTFKPQLKAKPAVLKKTRVFCAIVCRCAKGPTRSSHIDFIRINLSKTINSTVYSFLENSDRYFLWNCFCKTII